MATRINMADLRKKKPEDLVKMLGELNKEHLDLRMQQGNRQLSRTSDLRVVRRNVARILTLLRQSRGEAT